MHRHVRPLYSSKNETLLWQGVCVWFICRDVKTSTFVRFFCLCRGHAAIMQNACQRSYAWWWKPGLITLVYLHCCDYLLFRVCFHSIVNVWWWEEAQPKNLQVNFISSRLPQSVFSPKPCRRCILLTSPKPHRRLYFDFFRQYHVANVFWWRFWTWRTMQENFYYLKMHRWFLCFLSNLHVSGFSSCRITQMIHSCLVCDM